jgi:SecD/SecF fusion protein
MTVIARRLREFRVTNWTLRAEGNDRIAIDLPGTKDLEALTVARWVGVSAKLDFRLVNTTVSLSPQEVIQGRVPTDSEVLYEQEGGQRVPILVYTQFTPRAENPSAK